jgi:hypothetical protein
MRPQVSWVPQMPARRHSSWTIWLWSTNRVDLGAVGLHVPAEDVGSACGVSKLGSRRKKPFELHVLDACLAEGSRLRLDVPEEKREELFFLIAKVDTLFAPEELHEFPGGRKPSRRISVRGSPAQPQCLHESIVMVARERDQGGVALHSTTLGCSVIRAVLGELRGPLEEDELVVNMVTPPST